MTSPAWPLGDAIEALMADLASSERSAPFARRWARTPPGEFAAVEVRSWDDGASGGADVEFADGAGPTVAELEARFGPFQQAAPLSRGTPVLRNEWWREGLPVRIVLMVFDPPAGDARVEVLRLQRGRWRPDGTA